MNSVGSVAHPVAQWQGAKAFLGHKKHVLRPQVYLQQRALAVRPLRPVFFQSLSDLMHTRGAGFHPCIWAEEFAIIGVRLVSRMRKQTPNMTWTAPTREKLRLIGTSFVPRRQLKFRETL